MPTQFGFRENYSTTLAIAHLYDQILKERDKNNVVGCIFCSGAGTFFEDGGEGRKYK